MTLLSAGLLVLAAGCSTAGQGEGDGVTAQVGATVKAAASSGDVTGGSSGGASPNPVSPPSAATPSTAGGVVTPVLPRSSGTVCSPLMLVALLRTFEGRSSTGGNADVRVERCSDGYARAFAPATGGEQYFLQYENETWRVVAQGTGLGCGDPDAGRALLRACTALEYPTTAVLERISDPQVAADQLVSAWIRHDTTAANRLTRDGAPIEVLFSHEAPSAGAAPEAIPCRLVSLGRFACSYTLAPRAELTIIVEGGASAGYEVTGAEYGD